jgi:hypothetical protein
MSDELKGQGNGRSMKKDHPDSDQNNGEPRLSVKGQAKPRVPDQLTSSLEESELEADPLGVRTSHSSLDKLTDRTALLSHDAHLAAGTDRYFDDLDVSSLVDLVRDLKSKQIHVSLFQLLSSGAELSHAPKIHHEGQTYVVPKLPASIASSLILPTGLADYGKTLELFHNVESLLQKHLLLSGKPCKLLTYWCISTWFLDVLPFVPALLVTGPALAADHLFRVLRCVCWRPILLGGISSAVFRAIAVEQLRPTLFIREPRMNKRKIQLLSASDQPGYLTVHGKETFDCYSARCIYIGEHNDQVWDSTGIHLHVAIPRLVPGAAGIPSQTDTQLLQNQLFRYRCFNHDLVAFENFEPGNLSPETVAMGLHLGAAIVDDTVLQHEVIDLLKEHDEQARVDRAITLNAVVLKAVLHHCHEGEQQQVLVRDLTATVNNLYRVEGEPTKLSNERLGRVLKGLGLYTRRVKSAGRGLILDNATRLRIHDLSYADEALPDVPACGYCHRVQVPENE